MILGERKYMTERTHSPRQETFSRQAIFSQIDVTSVATPSETEISVESAQSEFFFRQQLVMQNQTLISQQKQMMTQMQQRHSELIGGLRELVVQQRRQNDYLAQMIQQQMSGTRQRMQEMQQWRAAHPTLARECRQAIEALGRIQAEYYTKIVDEIESNGDTLEYGDFMINEFIDRFGPRIVHLNGLIQTLAQLAVTEEEEAML